MDGILASHSFTIYISTMRLLWVSWRAGSVGAGAGFYDVTWNQLRVDLNNWHANLLLEKRKRMDLNRRSFVGILGGGLAAAATAGTTAPLADAQLVYQRTDWHSGDFEKLLKDPASVKQVFDVRPIGD